MTAPGAFGIILLYVDNGSEIDCEFSAFNPSGVRAIAGSFNNIESELFGAMASQGTITLVPSVHFSRTHRRHVRDTIREQDPDLVAVELGERRFEQLVQNTRVGHNELAEELPPVSGATYRTLKILQQTVARLYGLDPGKTDMETAVETSAELDTPLALIDEPITQIFAALSTRVGLETIPAVLIRSRLMNPMSPISQFKLMTIPMQRIENGDDVQPAIDYLRRLLPEVTEVLIDRRDRIMAYRLHKLRREGYDVVAIIGAGHHNGIQRTLDKLAARDADPTVSVPLRSPSQQGTETQTN